MSSTRLTALAETVALEFLETAAQLERRLDRALSVRGISFSEYRLLTALSAAGEAGCARIDLAMAVGLTASAVTRALKPLEKLGCLATSRNERDARQSLAILTPAGAQLLEEARGVLRDLLGQLPLSGLSRAQLAELQAGLMKFR